MKSKYVCFSLLGFLGMGLAFLSSDAFSAQEEPVIGVVSFSSTGAGKSLIENGGLEQVKNGRFVGVGSYEKGYAVRPGEGRNQSMAAYCENPDGTQGFGLSWSFQLNQTVPDAIRFTGWSKADSVAGSPGSNYSLYIDIIYRDGTPLWGQTADFSAGTHDWEEKSVLVVPDKPIRTLNCYALFRQTQGRVWFDDFTITVFETPKSMTKLDGLSVFVNHTIPRSSENQSAQSGDGLALTLDSHNSGVTGIMDGTVPLTLSDTPSGFLARDVGKESGYFPFVDGKCQELGLELNYQVESSANHIRLTGKLSDPTRKPRAISLLFAVPVDAVGWNWWDHLRGSAPIQNNNEYMSQVTIGVGSNGKLSRYPFACVTSGRSGIALGMDMGTPAQWRLGYSAGTRLFYLAYDFGLHPDVERFPASASFSFVLYRVDPAWGFRAAAKKFYEIFPAYFDLRARDQGIWMPFTDVSTVQGWQDFGFKYHEGNNNIPFDDQSGILSFRYSEPSTWWMSMSKETLRTYEAAMKMVQEYADSTQSSNNRIHARSLLASGSFNETDRFQMLFRNEPWSNGAVFSLNPSPYLAGAITNASEMWNEEIARRLYGPTARGIQDGEYLDSLEGYVTADLNFRVEHFRRATIPLTFTLDTRRPVIYKAFSALEFTRYLSEQVHDLGKLLFANSVPYRYSFLCPWLDVMGTETDWIQDGQFIPESDETMNFRRTLCFKKPYLFLMNTQFENLTSDRVEKYFQRCLFYGMFPSMFSHNAADNPYWQNPTLYNRDRALFKKYQPVIKQTAEAGWEPVTGARTNQSEVWLERFGPDDGGKTYFTVFNSGSKTRTAHLSGESAYAGKGRWEALLSGGSGDWSGGFDVSLNPGETQVYRVTMTNGNPSGILWKKEEMKR